jgi:hypothetical protein
MARSRSHLFAVRNQHRVTILLLGIVLSHVLLKVSLIGSRDSMIRRKVRDMLKFLLVNFHINTSFSRPRGNQGGQLVHVTKTMFRLGSSD